MTTQTKHTPLNWRWSTIGLHNPERLSLLSSQIEVGRFEGSLGDEQDEANAAFIVKAVNTHYQLVEACRAACKAASDCLPPSGEGELDAGYYKAKLLAIDEAASKCSAALALAEKGME